VVIATPLAFMAEAPNKELPLIFYLTQISESFPSAVAPELARAH
jgi:hypothetical protein